MNPLGLSRQLSAVLLNIATSLVGAQDTNWREAQPTIGANRALIARSRIDRQPMMPADIEEVARHSLEGIPARPWPWCVASTNRSMLAWR